MKTRSTRFADKFLGKRSRWARSAIRRFSLVGLEPLEVRALLTAASALQSDYHDAASSLSGEDAACGASTMRSLLASSCASASSAQESNNASAPNVSPLATTSYSTLDEPPAASPMNAPEGNGEDGPLVTPLVEGVVARFSVEVQDLSNNPITTSILVGQDFQLAAFVEDLRDPPLPPNGTGQLQAGLWSAFMNVSYDAPLASITAHAHSPGTPDSGFKFGDYFKDGLKDGDVSVDGQIVEAGSSSLKFEGSGTGPVLLWRITVHADAAGTLTFDPSFDTNLDHEAAFITPPDQLLSGNIQFVSDSVEIAGPPEVSITPSVSANEGNSSTTPFVFTVSLSAPSAEQVTVVLATSNTTATAGQDYVSRSETLTFAPQDTSKLVTILVNGDTAIEADETFNVALSSPTNATLGASATGIGTIQNDDVPVIGISGVSQVEGNETNTLVFTVTISQPSAVDVLVPFETQDGTATLDDDDYVATSGTLTFAAGNGAPQLVTVTINGDTVNEQNETFRLVLSQPAGAVFDGSNGEAEATLLNDDGPHITFTQQSVSHLEGDDDTTDFVFTVDLGAATDIPVTVVYSTANGADPLHSATAGSDYTAISGTLTFLPEDPQTKSLTVLVNGDTLGEADEEFVLNLSNPVNATLTHTSATGTIENDDPLPSLSFDLDSVSLAEGDSGSAAMVFTVNLSFESGQDVTVQYQTVDGTATSAANDYTAIAPTTLTFAAGETQKFITVLITGDFKDEPDESFTLDLFNSSGASNAGSLLTKLTATGTILNDDEPPLMTIIDVTHTESDGNPRIYAFVATLSSASGHTITVPFATEDGTATVAGNDYTATSGTLTFLPGQTSATITVLAGGDTFNEPTETFKVNLTPSDNVILDRTTAIGTIEDEDPQPEILVTGGGAKNEGNSDTTDFVFTVSLTQASGQQITVNFTTSDGTATVTNQDYVGQNGVLTFAPGETTKFVTVAVNGDTRNEADETFNFVLSDPINAALVSGDTGTPFGQGLILNDDNAPTLSINDVTQAEGDSSTTNFVFTVSLSTLSGQTVTVAFATANGTATLANNDYTATSGTLTFLPGVGSRNITVQVKGDLLDEPNETFLVNLSTAVNATIADGQGTGTIQDETTDNITFTPSSFSGIAFADVNGNKMKDFLEKLLPDVAVTLTGISDISGQDVNLQTTTVANGAYAFDNLDPGDYDITFAPLPGFHDWELFLSNASGASVVNNAFHLDIPSLGGISYSNNNVGTLGERSTVVNMRPYTASAMAARAAAAAAAAAAQAAPMVAALAATSSPAEQATVTQNGTTVTVHGTSGDDQFAFTAGSTNVVTINGQTHEYSPASVTSIVFDGGGGQDSAVLTGSGGNDEAELSIGSGVLSGLGFSVSVNDVNALSVNGGGGNDTAVLHDSALSDQLQADGDSLSLSNELGAITSLLAFAQVQAISDHGGEDTSEVGTLDFALEQQGDWLAL